MNQTNNRSIFYHSIFILAVALLLVIQGNTLAGKNNDSMKLTVELTDSNVVQLNWKTIFEANYYKVFRAEVSTDTDPTAKDIEYIELGVSETNEFSDSNIKKDGEKVSDETLKEDTVYLYYVAAIDAWEKEIEKSEVVKFNFPIKLEKIQ